MALTGSYNPTKINEIQISVSIVASCEGDGSHKRRLKMHKIDRAALLKAFGHCSVTPGYLQAHKTAVSNYGQHEKAINLILDLIIEGVKEGDDFPPSAIEALQQVKRLVADLSNCYQENSDDSHEFLLRLVGAQRELAELKCRILETETAPELLELQREIRERRGNEIVSEAIAYLDQD
jgi:hypothetical protein